MIRQAVILRLLVLVLVAVLATAVLESERPIPPEPCDAVKAGQLSALARVILITPDGPVRDERAVGPHLAGLQAISTPVNACSTARRSKWAPRLGGRAAQGDHAYGVGVLTGHRLEVDAARVVVHHEV